MNFVVILSAWGTGSTALTGFLDACGAYTGQSHVTTEDVRTPVTFEPLEYRNLLTEYFDEYSLKVLQDTSTLLPRLRVYLDDEMARAKAAGAECFVLKHPLQVFALPMLEQIARPRYVVLTRPFAEIERTRLRRQWMATMGAEGARHIYNLAYTQAHELGFDYFSLSFQNLREREGSRRALLDFVGLNVDSTRLELATQFLR